MKSYLATFLFMLLFLVSTITDSSAQLKWTKDPVNPVLSGGSLGTWNRHINMTCVLYNTDSLRYEMWYTASAGAPNWHPFSIGYATSKDGINWLKNDTAVLETGPGTWEKSDVEAPMVLRENGQYKMWYTGWYERDSARIGYATSPDGITWEKYAGNPVMGAGTATWEAAGAGFCQVMPVEGGYKMWYVGADADLNTAIAYATSSDGINWARDTLNNPVLERGKAGQWDDYYFYAPKVVFIKDKYYMLYVGSPNEYGRKIGLAYSTDGISWKKHNDPSTTSTFYADSDPVLVAGPGNWEGSGVENGNIIVEGNILHMWYDGTGLPQTTYPWKIGHATLSLDTLIPLGIEQPVFNGSPQEFSLKQNYPNPFNPITNIEFQIPNSEFTTLKVYNILGEEMATLVSAKLNPGNHTYTFNGKNLASGVYYYQLVAGDFKDVRKMILLR